jgi:hypothetical protein
LVAGEIKVRRGGALLASSSLLLVLVFEEESSGSSSSSTSRGGLSSRRSSSSASKLFVFATWEGGNILSLFALFFFPVDGRNLFNKSSGEEEGAGWEGRTGMNSIGTIHYYRKKSKYIMIKYHHDWLVAP